MSFDHLLFCTVFKDIVTATKCRKVHLSRIMHVMVRVSAFDFIELCESLFKLVLNSLVLIVDESKLKVAVLAVITGYLAAFADLIHR